MSDPAASFFIQLGGAPGVRQLVDDFYDAMDAFDAVRPIRAMHPPSLDSSREKLTLFLCGWLGGPPLYVERFGHPRLRARHMPFTIDSAARDQWMTCMQHALSRTSLSLESRDKLTAGFLALADHLRNHA